MIHESEQPGFIEYMMAIHSHSKSDLLHNNIRFGLEIA